SHDVSALQARAVEPSPGPVLVVLLHAGGARDVPVDEQVRPPRCERLQRADGAGGQADERAAWLAGEGGHPGGASQAGPVAVAPPRRADGPGEPQARGRVGEPKTEEEERHNKARKITKRGRQLSASCAALLSPPFCGFLCLVVALLFSLQLLALR